eukprot:1781573-Pyramimonas_sp.AAC.1
MVLATPKNTRARASTGMRWLSGRLHTLAGLTAASHGGGPRRLAICRKELARLREALQQRGHF